MLDISVDEPVSVFIESELNELPERRAKEIALLSADLDNQYQIAKQKQSATISAQKSGLLSGNEHLKRELSQKQAEISRLSHEIDRKSREIETMSEQIKKDTVAIRWMIAWRVFWGIICTAGFVIVVFFLIIKFIFKVIDFFVGSHDNDDD